MVDKRLVNYISDGLQKGYSVEDLRSALLKQGWSSTEIQGATSIVQGKSGAPTGDQGVPKIQPGQRPTGVTIISILGFLGSIITIILGIFLVATGSFIASLGSLGGIDNQTLPNVFLGFLPVLGLFTTLFGLIFILIGVFGLIAFYLLLKMKKIGWLLVIILGIISVIISILTLNIGTIPGVVIWIVILIYLILKRDLFA